MSEKAGPVEIVVDIVGNFQDELEKLEKRLDEIDAKKVDVDFEIDSEGEIKKVKAQLKQLKKDINTDLDIDVDGAAKAQATKTALSKDMRSTLRIGTDIDEAGGGILKGAFGPDGPDLPLGKDAPLYNDAQMDFLESMHDHQSTASRLRSAIDPNLQRAPTQEFFGGRNLGVETPPKFDAPDIGDPMTGKFGMRRVADWPDFTPGVAGGGGRGPTFGFLDDADRKLQLDEMAKNSRKNLRKLFQTLDKFRPNIMMVWNALAAFIPIFISLGAAAIGLAGGMIAIASAGAAILGLGLLGWGKDFQSNLQNLQQEARKLGSQLFDILQPAARTAQPIMQDWMEGMPRQVQRLVDPLRQLMTAFEGTLGQIGVGLVDWIVRVVNQMVSMEGIISQIVLRFGKIAGDFLIEFMTNMVQFAYENQAALIEMSGAIRDLLGVLLKFSIFVVRILSVLTPLVTMLNWVAGILSNRWVAGITTTILTLYAMHAAITAVTAALAAQNGWLLANIANIAVRYLSAVYGAIVATYQWVASVWQLNAALGVLAGLLTVATGGLALLAGATAAGFVGGQIPNGPGGGGGGVDQTVNHGGTTINIQGDVDKKQMDRLLDEVPAETRNEMNFNSEMDR